MTSARNTSHLHSSVVTDERSPKVEQIHRLSPQISPIEYSPRVTAGK